MLRPFIVKVSVVGYFTLYHIHSRYLLGNVTTLVPTIVYKYYDILILINTTDILSLVI